MVDLLTEFLRLFEIRPEEVGSAFAELVVGGGGTATFDGILQSIYLSNPDFWTEKFPFMGFPVFPENLPPVDDWITAGIPAVLALLGIAAKDKDLFRVGLGGCFYGGGMLLHRTITRNLPRVIRPGSSHSLQGTREGKYKVTH